MRVHSELPARAELVVIGAGIVGAATAFRAAQAGLEPVVVERRPVAASLTTAVAAGGYRLQLDHREELDLVSRTLALIEAFAEITGQTAYDPRLERAGYLWMTSHPATAERQRELVARQREWGVDGVELLGAPELRERFPWVGGSVLQARFRQSDGLIDPRAIALGLLARQRVELGVTVTGFEAAGGRLAAVRDRPRADRLRARGDRLRPAVRPGGGAGRCASCRCRRCGGSGWWCGERTSCPPARR